MPPVLTLPMDVGCVSFYEFWERENSLEIKVRCWIATIEVTACAVRGLM